MRSESCAPNQEQKSTPSSDSSHSSARQNITSCSDQQTQHSWHPANGRSNGQKPTSSTNSQKVHNMAIGAQRSTISPRVLALANRSEEVRGLAPQAIPAAHR